MSGHPPACWRTAATGPIPVKSARLHTKGRDHSEGHQPAHPRTAISTREAQSGGPPPTHTAPARRNHPPRSPPLTPPPAACPDTTATTTHPRPPEPRAHYTKPLHHLTRPLQHRLASCALRNELRAVARPGPWAVPSSADTHRGRFWQLESELAHQPLVRSERAARSAG